MRIASVSGLALLLLGACGGDEAVSPEPDGVRLARIGLLGDLPRDGGRVLLSLGPDATLRLGGARVSFEDLERRLASLPGGPAPEEGAIRAPRATEEVVDLPPRDPAPREFGDTGPGGVRNADVLLRVDRDAPWALVERLLLACAHPTVKLPRLFFAFEGEDGKGEGAVAVFLPMDAGIGATPTFDGEAVALRIAPADEPGAFDECVECLRKRRPEPATLLEVTLRSDPLAPFAEVARALDAALRANVYGFTFGRATHDLSASTPEEILASAREPRGWRIEVGGEDAMAYPAGRALVPGRSIGLYGFSNRVAIRVPRRR
jgi:hypothetical protein